MSVRMIVFSLYRIIIHWINIYHMLSKEAHRGINPKVKAIGYKCLCVFKQLGFVCNYLHMATSYNNSSTKHIFTFLIKKIIDYCLPSGCEKAAQQSSLLNKVSGHHWLRRCYRANPNYHVDFL